MIQMSRDLRRASTEGKDIADPEEIERVVTHQRIRVMPFSEEKHELTESGGFGEFMKKKRGSDS